MPPLPPSLPRPGTRDQVLALPVVSLCSSPFLILLLSLQDQTSKTFGAHIGEMCRGWGSGVSTPGSLSPGDFDVQAVTLLVTLGVISETGGIRTGWGRLLGDRHGDLPKV